MRPITFALVGALTGTAAAACTFVQIGEVDAIEIGRYCFGVRPISGGTCRGIDGAMYVFPGLVFGVVFGLLLHFYGYLSGARAVAYAVAALLANAVAVSVCLSALHPVGDLLPFNNLELDTAISGAIAGAVGGGLLGAALAMLNPAARRALPIGVAAGLGLLTPLVIMFDLGVFAFYILWQAGYAAAVAISLPRPRPGLTAQSQR